MDSTVSTDTAVERINDLEECLLFMCRHFDLPVSRAAIRDGLSGDDQELTLSQFTQVAERQGLVAAIGPHKLSQINQAMLPLIVPLQFGRAVVIIAKNSDDTFVVADPKNVSRDTTVTLSELEALFLGHVIVCRTTANNSRKSNQTQSSAKHWFWAPIRRNWWIYGQVLLAAFLSNVLSLSVMIFIMVVYDRIIPNNATESLLVLTIGVGIALLFDLIVKSLRAIFVDRAGERADLSMGMQLYNHLLDISMAERRGSTGTLASMLREFESLREFFTSASLVALVDLPFILLFIGVIYLVGGPLAYVPIITVPLILLMGLLVQPVMRRLAKDSIKQNQQKQSVVVETLTGLETIKTSRAAPIMRNRWQNAILDHSKFSSKSRWVSQIMLNITGFSQQVAQVAVIVYGAALVQKGEVTMGALVASVMMTSRCLAPLAQLAQTLTRIFHIRASYDALNKLMHRQTERVEGRSYISRSKLEGKIEFRHVFFRYPEQDNDALSDISFTINPGEKVAFLGKIGSGKSTVARLLLGLYEPLEGSILVDNTDLRQIDPSDLRANIGSVLQDICLFTGSVRQNIAMGGNRPSDEEILRVAELAGVHDFISQTPQGYDLLLAERGEGLSGGQRQAIAIARALISKPSILLMDEPTSSMDGASELQLIKRLKVEMSEKTLIVVTHRTTLLELVDRVIVIDRGRVVADGPKSILQGPPGGASQPANPARSA
ncbi:MAG: type I secretion system permease/ATPase [Magnetococcales bacterium]|nr:type I secretion system permease/ATPase [Magnetococcales bacterium]